MLNKTCSSLCVPLLLLVDILRYCYHLLLRDGVHINKIKFLKTCDRAVVLGNGPSLNLDRDRVVSRVGISDFVCVNTFCNDELYPIVKPKIYVFLDPIFFTEHVNKCSKDKREHVFRTLNTKTEWDMLVLLPNSADIRVLQSMITNQYVRILKYNGLMSSMFFRYGAMLRVAFDIGFYGPPRINVLVHALFLSIRAGYKKIELFGADFDYHKKLEVHQDTNELLLRAEYFNAPTQVVSIKTTILEESDLTASEFFYDVSVAYGAFNMVKLYARDCKVKIVNCSSYSMLDMFERDRV